MRSHLVMMGGVFRKDSSKVLRVKRDQMISALAPDRPDLILASTPSNVVSYYNNYDVNDNIFGSGDFVAFLWFL
jgi:hypothetical protein